MINLFEVDCQRDSDAVKASAGEQRRRRPSSGFHRVACCTSGEFPSCWCRGNAAHTVHTCEHGRVRPRRTMSPRYAPEGRTDPLAAPDRTKAPLRVRFASLSAWYAWDGQPSIDSIRLL